VGAAGGVRALDASAATWCVNAADYSARLREGS
jgi:hypothetical protein